MTLRKAVERSELCTLKAGCEVISKSSNDPIIIEYLDRDRVQKSIKAQWLIGADGKTGIIRKHFLEKSAGIRQENGKYRYDGTWIAANLKIDLPTPKSHPSLPFWEHGYSPEDVYDLFWPQGWHFCSPPGLPTATGRFGPREDRTWRHELGVENWNDNMNAEELFWDHLKPMITLSADKTRGIQFAQNIQYPMDCINILRCRPFKFTHKIVNRWYDGRTILIGDAAHVFPPFAGQGIGSGMRDAHQLAWRLAAILHRQSNGSSFSKQILDSWALERRQSVEDAAYISKLSGMLVNNKPAAWLRILLSALEFVENHNIPLLPSMDPAIRIEQRGFTTVQDGFFCKNQRGGARLAQIHMESSRTGKLLLSDTLLQPPRSLFTLFAICKDGDVTKARNEAEAVISSASLSKDLVSTDSIVVLSDKSQGIKNTDNIETFHPASSSRLEEQSIMAEDSEGYFNRLGSTTRFALVRADLFVFSCSRDKKELEAALSSLKSHL